jgi:hypothetical protein
MRRRNFHKRAFTVCNAVGAGLLRSRDPGGLPQSPKDDRQPKLRALDVFTYRQAWRKFRSFTGVNFSKPG